MNRYDNVLIMYSVLVIVSGIMNEFFVIDSIMLVKVVMKMFVRLFVKFWMLLSDVMCVGVGVILLMSVYMLVLVNDRLVYVSVNRLR